MKAGEGAILNWVRRYSLLLADYIEAVIAERKVDDGRKWHEDIAVLKKGRKCRCAFLLKGRGGSEDIVLTMQGLRENEVPYVLESKLLGIKLIGSLRTPPFPPIQSVAGANQ